MVANAKSVNKVEVILKKALHLMLNDHECSYKDLLKRSGKPSMNLQKIRTLYIKIYKTINKIKPRIHKKSAPSS